VRHAKSIQNNGKKKKYKRTNQAMTYPRVCNKSNTTGVICGAGTANPSREPEFTPVFSEVRVARSLVFCVMFCVSLCVLLSFSSLTLCCLSFDIRLLITPVVSSNFSSDCKLYVSVLYTYILFTERTDTYMLSYHKLNMDI